jgi:hypothetical protein
MGEERRGEECIYGFDRKTKWKQIARKTCTLVGGYY